MKTSASWSPAASLNVVSVERGERAWTVTVNSRQPASCPGCGAPSSSRHSDRRIFTERLPSLAAPFVRQTARLGNIVRLLGHSTGGRPSERLLRRLGMPISDTTILRSLKQHAGARSDSEAVHVAGIDDWAWRKGAEYGTIIVDLERRQVGDLLADRSAATMTSWFKDHPEVDVISRDRSGIYADAGRQGAPQARQVADRFHLLQNFRETIERQLGRYEAPIPDTRVNTGDRQAVSSNAVTQKRLVRRGRQAVRQKLFDEIRALFLKVVVPLGKSPTSSVLAADGLNVGSAA